MGRVRGDVKTDFRARLDKRGRKGAKLGKRINRSWVGKGAAKLSGHCWNLCKTWTEADAGRNARKEN